MSVILRGMEMPKNCSDCPLNYDQMACKVTGTRWWSDTMVLMGFDSDKERLHDCPLIELPPHGDLVDLSDTVHPNDSMRCMTIDEQLRRTCEGWSADRKQYVVIEAEGETDA